MSSVLVNALADDTADGDRARVLADPDLHAASLVDVEMLAVLHRHLNAGTLDDRRVARLSTIWAHRSDLTAYDAAYVVLAELLDFPLVTADRRLDGGPGLTCPVKQLC